MNRAQRLNREQRTIERVKRETGAPHPLSQTGRIAAPSEPNEAQSLTWPDPDTGETTHGFLLGVDTLGTKNCVLRVGPTSKNYGG